MTLVETMIFVILALIVLAMLFQFFASGGRIFELAGRQSAATMDARNVMEALNNDVRASHLIDAPRSAADWARDHTLRIYRFASTDTHDRVKKNVVSAGHSEYPNDSDTGHTEQYLDVQRVTYTMEGALGTNDGAHIVRTETGGYLKRTVDDAQNGPQYDFEADRSVRARDPGPDTLAWWVKTFNVQPLAIAPADARGHRRIVPAGTAGTTMEQTALVMVGYVADHTAPGHSTPEGSIELTTKIWIDQQSLALRFPDFFSTVDSELSY